MRLFIVIGWRTGKNCGKRHKIVSQRMSITTTYKTCPQENVKVSYETYARLTSLRTWHIVSCLADLARVSTAVILRIIARMGCKVVGVGIGWW